MTEVLDITLLLPILMYAETHYRFPYFFSFLKKDEPEIIADAPHRIEPGSQIPLLILAKDAHLFPSILHQIIVTVSQGSSAAFQRTILKKSVMLRKKWWWSVYRISAGGLKGWVDIDVQMEIESRGMRRTYHNDNYRTSSKRSLRVFLAESPLPRLPGLHFGDGHVHSYYTDDQVEYGAPPEASVILSRSLGLSYFSITDHSYDLDDKVDDYLLNDPTIPKWKSLQKEVSLLNRRHADHKILLGEEVSCRNSRGDNVHLLLYGNRDYVPGSGDSAERWFHTNSEMSIADILKGGFDGIAAAAHPCERVPLLQKLLLRRGKWAKEDLILPGICGTQFLNGDSGDGFQRGKDEWLSLLLSGVRIFAIAGNDAHGNFNRFRQIALPFFLVSEHGRQLFGGMRTGLFLRSRLSEDSIISTMRLGRIIISDGPVAAIHASNAGGEAAFLGGQITGARLHVRFTAASSEEFGVVQAVRLYCGLFGRKREEIIFDSHDIREYKYEHVLSFDSSQSGYLRLEVTTSGENEYDNRPHFCLTNPIWFNHTFERNKKPFGRRA